MILCIIGDKISKRKEGREPRIEREREEEDKEERRRGGGGEGRKRKKGEEEEEEEEEGRGDTTGRGRYCDTYHRSSSPLRTNANTMNV